MSIAYRATQFFRLLFTKPASQDLQLVNEILPVSLQSLFQCMSTADQNHAIRVLHTLLDQGEQDPELLAAALLHDVGKTRLRPHIWDRIAVVLGTALVPNATRRWGRDKPHGWKRAFVIAANHPAWGAQMILASGGSEELAALVQRHQDPPVAEVANEMDRLLRKLQDADGRN